MWNKISQVAGLASAETEDEQEEEKKSAMEDKEHLEQQELLIQHLKYLVRENEKRFQDKTKEFDELSSKFQKFKLQSKAKISHLSSQIKDQEKTAKKEDCEFDDASSSDSSDQSRRGKVLLFKKQLEQVKQQLDKKEKECKNLTEGYERRINDLELQLNEKNILISTLADAESKEKTPESSVDKSRKKESSVQEMYAQIVYKDSKIMELNNQILEHEKQIMDLQEHIKEKDEVLQQRSRAVQLMAEDMSRKGKSVVNELDETRAQMKIMQENFSSNESDWKVQIDKYKLRISELENDVSEMDKKVKSCEVFIKNLEAAKYELTVKNAELQKKIVSVQESAAKQCELYNKEIGGEVETWKKSLESEKQKVSELQKTLDEMNSQSDNKVLKARVKERTKFKALERELNELKKANEEKPKETLELEQRVAELEEEKGSLQLKLMEIEEQVSQLEKLKDQNKLLHANVEEGLNKIQNFEKQILELQEGREKWEAKFETLNESYNELTDKFNVTAREKSDLQEKFTDLLSSKEKIEVNYNDFKKDHSNIENMFKEVSENYQQMKDQKVTFELKNIELEEIKENDEKTIKQLLSRIAQLQESFSNESKPDIQLEKENLELKDKLRTLSDNCKGLENKNLNLLSQIDLLQIKLTEEQNEKNSKINEIGEKMNHVDIKYQEVLKTVDVKTLECTEKEKNILELEHKFDGLQHKLTEEQNGHAAEMKKLLDKFNDIELNYQEISHNCNDKTLECTEKEKIAKELENNLTQVQNELSHVLIYFGVKNANDCINYTAQKAEEYARLETDYNKEIVEKNNLLLTLTEKGSEFENLGSKVEKLEFLLEKRDEDLRILETYLEDLKETISEKETIIYNLSSELENKISALSSLNKAFEEKSELLKIVNKSQNTLLEELKVFKASHISNQEKTHANTTSLLGQISDLEMEIASLRDELSIKQTIIEDLNSDVASLLLTKEDVMAQVKENENFIQEKESEISCLREKLITKDKAMEELNNTLCSLQDANQEILTKIEEKQNVILEKEDLISNLKSSMDLNKDLFSSLQAENESFKNTLTDNVSEISSLNQKLQKFDHLLKARSDELSGINEKLHETLKSLKEMEEELIILKNKNELLEKEKLHSNLSLTEKDELHKQILTDKLQLEVDIQKLQNENKSLNSLLNEKVDELDVFDSTINKLSNLIKGNGQDVQEFLKQLFDDNNKLARFAEKWFSLLTDNQNLGSEISNSKNQLLQIQSVVEKHQEELNETNLSLKDSQKQSDEKSTKLGMLENDLKLSCDLKSKLDAELYEMQEKIQNLSGENNTLQAKLSTLQEEHLSQSSSLNSNLSNYQKKLEDALAMVENLQTENLKLTEQFSHLNASLKSCELKEKLQEKEIQGLNETCLDFENKAVKLNDLNKNLNQKIQSFEKEFTQATIKQTEEKSALELLHQNLISDNKKIHESNIELQARIDHFENEKHLNECSASELKALIMEKDLQITNLNSQLDALAKKLSSLQTDFNQKQDEHEKYNESFKAKLMCYQNFKHHYYTVLEALRSSQQISTDISFLNSDDLNTESIDELAELSKNVVKDVVAHLSEFQYRNSQYSDMEDNIKQLQAENINLSSEICTLTASLTNLTEILQENLEQNEKTFGTIMSDFSAKENALMNTISKTVSVSTLLNSQKNHIVSLESDLSLKVEQLQTVQGSLLKLEDLIKTLTKENEEISRDASLSVQKYKENISEMDATLENVARDFNSLQESFELKQKELENCLQSNQELKNALSSRNEQISKILEEQENSNNYVVILQSDLERAHSTISALQNEIRTLNNQISEHELEPHVLEASNNVSNGLQVEVETLRLRLTSYEEEKTSLKQHIDNTNLQLQSLVNEKSILEASMEQMQHKLNDVIETNLGLTGSFEGSKSVIIHHQNIIKDLEEKQSECLANYERIREERERLKLENAALDSNKSMNLNKITVMEENVKIFTNIVEKISILLNSGNLESEFYSLIMNVHLQDESLTDLISRLDTSVHNFKKVQVKEKNDMLNTIKALECKHNELSKVLGKNDTQEKQQNERADKNVHTKDITIVPSSDFSSALDTNLLQQQASPVVESSEFLALENENKALKREVNEYKIKFAKSLSKLKLFKDKFEKLSAEFKQLKDKNSELEAINSSSAQKEENIEIRVAALSKENEKLLRQVQLRNEQNKHELDKSNYIISQLRERIALSDEECFRIQQELQEYKQTWEQSNISYELQKEDNERLRMKLKEFQEQNEAYKTSVAEINSELTQLRNENVHWKQEVENLREHANMLLSDNDTYQILIEKLTLSKSSLEQKLSESKEKFNLELKSLQSKHDGELKKFGDGVSESMYQEPKHVKDLETECILLKTRCLEMQKYTEIVEQERNTSLRNQNLLEKEKMYLQQQLMEKAGELQTCRTKLNDCVKYENLVQSASSDTNSVKSVPEAVDIPNPEIEDIQVENRSFKLQLDSLSQELNVTKENFQALQQDCLLKENSYKDEINKLKVQLQGKSELTVNLPKENKNLESELRQAMASLHNQGLRCEELSLEVSKLLEERNILKWKLQQAGQHPVMKEVADAYATASSELISVKVESPSFNADVAALHARLSDSERTCQQLRQANDALDRALVNEKDQRRIIEEELGYAKDHLTEEAKASDEYHILLGDVNEPEYFAETNFAISRSVRTHAYKLRRWLRGRRNYFWRTVKSRNYSYLVYILYIFCIHIWLLACVFS